MKCQLQFYINSIIVDVLQFSVKMHGYFKTMKIYNENSECSA